MGSKSGFGTVYTDHFTFLTLMSGRLVGVQKQRIQNDQWTTRLESMLSA